MAAVRLAELDWPGNTGVVKKNEGVVALLTNLLRERGLDLIGLAVADGWLLALVVDRQQHTRTSGTRGAYLIQLNAVGDCAGEARGVILVDDEARHALPASDASPEEIILAVQYVRRAGQECLVGDVGALHAHIGRRGLGSLDSVAIAGDTALPTGEFLLPYPILELEVLPVSREVRHEVELLAERSHDCLAQSISVEEKAPVADFAAAHLVAGKAIRV